ncbi:MAG: hypothetical protein IJ702_03255 [Fretibacterium sp.]|nr:hypothetical protein [Fretibacterium sp.]
MPVYSRNKLCDVEHWIGETALDDFEEFVFVDSIMDIPPFESYEEAIENFWPSFTAEASVS